MKLKFDFNLSVIKIFLPLLLISFSLLPITGIRLVIYNFLWLPFSWLIRFPPFVCSDKPLYVANTGAFLAAVIWSGFFYLIFSLKKS
jgi:hypothetical protein